ncbi:MAG: type II toxin-antitoxin system antitoxin SocA domain-containing protein [Candidatus Methylomirabilia bacterium]
MKSSGGALGRRIKDFREQTGLSQEQLAVRVGVLRSTLSQMENGDRKVTAEDLLRLARVFNIATDELLDVKKPLRVTLAGGGPPGIADSPPERIHVPQEHVKKFKEVLLYILNRVGSKPHVGETVIYKLLYFIDFDYYERYEEQLVGATYIKNHYGPTPVEFKKIVELMVKEGALEKVKSTYFSFPQTKYLPRRVPDVSVLSAREVMLIDEVLCRLSDKNATEINEWSHKDVPWQTTDDGKPIEYESVFYRTAPYSARIADGEVR